MNSDLTSVVVITYNSAKTIVETLDSIANQTSAVEIVVTDDRSPDDTLAVVKEWGRRNPEVPLVVVASEVNTGVSGNINRGVKASHGKWLKLIAGDDMLVPDAIERYIHFCETTRTEVCVSMLEFFGTNQELIDSKKKYYGAFYRYYTPKTAAEKKRIVLRDCLIPMPGFFISKELFDRIGGIDERYPFGEEWPTYLKILEQGLDLPMFDEKLVLYRCSDNSLGARDGRVDERVFLDQKKFYKEVRRSKMCKARMFYNVLNQDINYYLEVLLYKKTHQTFWKRTFIILKLINPMTYINYMKHQKRIRKK